jgi:signal peptidase I
MERRSWIAAAVGTSALLAAAGHGLFRRFAVVEASMRPLIEPGDWIVGRRWAGSPRRGDIVVFEHPALSGRSLVKRVVGLPSERIDIARGYVHINGVVLAEPWVAGTTTPEGTWWVPPGHVWVLGDYRPASIGDSRHLGPIPTATLQWKALARYWPAARAGRL